MKDFVVTWTDKVQRSVVIPAFNADGALDKWRRGNYNPDSVCQDDVMLCEDEDVEVHEA